jgi:hypothetical protein
MLETASIAGGAVAMLLVFVIGFLVYLRKQNKKKNDFEVESQKSELCEKF